MTRGYAFFFLGGGWPVGGTRAKKGRCGVML